MRTNRLFIEQALTENTECVIDGTIAHRVSTVLRMRAGQQLHLFNGEGGDFPAEILQIEKKQVRLALSSQLPPLAESPLSITLLQSISKGQKMDFTLQKAVELGVNRIVPLIDQRSSVKLQSDRIQSKHAHWQSVIISAVEQSGRNVIPALVPAMNFQDGIEQEQNGTGIILSPTAKQALSTFDNLGQSLSLLVGSEGGFSEADLQAAQAAGFQAAGLGSRILRTETAALVAISICQSRWGDL